MLVSAPESNRPASDENGRGERSPHGALGTGHDAPEHERDKGCDVLLCSRDTMQRLADALDSGDVSAARAIVAEILKS